MTFYQMNPGRIVRAFLGVAVAVLICIPSARAQDKTLAPAAQDAMEHGFAAAQQQNYKLAYRYFLDGQKADPDASQIWFNLGLAAAKIPGHEFRAIAWFKAYLLANPGAKNATAVRAQITQLEVAFETRLSKIVDALEPLVKTIADNELIDPTSIGADGRYESRLTNGGLLAAMRLYLGDKNGAQKTRQYFGIGRGNVHNSRSSHIYGHFDRGLASAGVYDELIAKDWFSRDADIRDQAPDGALFAIERGNFDEAEHLYSRGGYSKYQSQGYHAISRDIVCKLLEFDRVNDAKKLVSKLFSEEDEKNFGADQQKWFDANCSGWWLKKGERDRLVDRGRGGHAITVLKSENHASGAVAQFDDTSIDGYLAALKKQLSGRYNSFTALDGALDSLADLFEAYRQMHGPYAD